MPDHDIEELKQMIRTRREVIAVMLAEIQVLTKDLKEKMGPVAWVEFLAASRPPVNTAKLKEN